MTKALPPLPRVLEDTWLGARYRLFAGQSPDGHWDGELSGSALSTAVAAFALAKADWENFRTPIRGGLQWLVDHAGRDGGWGDTPDSPSNLSTTVLAWAALSEAGPAGVDAGGALDRAEAWLTHRVGRLEPEAVTQALLGVYGRDRTFSAPILLMATLAGRRGPAARAWAGVPQLPFEISVLPGSLFRFLRLPVVSYALPALIAIGVCRHVNCPSRCPVTRGIRNRVLNRSLAVLKRIQPENGGFLEASPLTGFVVMSLAAAGQVRHPVCGNAIRFLLHAQRSSGCWPIDTNLATWVTTLAVNALAGEQTGSVAAPELDGRRLRLWLTTQQTRVRHAFTGAAPGGWAWTHLAGGVPDADDTAGAVLALHNLRTAADDTRPAAEAGLRWLKGLQNRDGGFPTFCRGWGKLPFDRSCPDITAHALHALAAWREESPGAADPRGEKGIRRALAYLDRAQDPAGFWSPLWFGNQGTAGQHNPVLGTARVLSALESPGLARRPGVLGMVIRARSWLQDAQGPDGGWGGDAGCPPSVEETALALGALAFCASAESVARGVQWLAEKTRNGKDWPSAPIGLYFASLWYSERLYPLVFALWALNRVRRRAAWDVDLVGFLSGSGEREPEVAEECFLARCVGEGS